MVLVCRPVGSPRATPCNPNPLTPHHKSPVDTPEEHSLAAWSLAGKASREVGTPRVSGAWSGSTGAPPGRNHRVSMSATAFAVVPRSHFLAAQHLARSDQNRRRLRRLAAHYVHAPVHAVDEIHVEMPWLTEHRGVSLRVASVGMRGRIGAHAAVGLDLGDPHGDRAPRPLRFTALEDSAE